MISLSTKKKLWMIRGTICNIKLTTLILTLHFSPCNFNMDQLPLDQISVKINKIQSKVIYFQLTMIHYQSIFKLRKRLKKLSTV